MAKHQIDISRVVVWCDYACISQDDRELQGLGISSLIAYAAQSDVIVIPVQPNAEEIDALAVADHPVDLFNYGDRAWCRLETYMFMCVGEILMRQTACYAFGMRKKNILGRLKAALQRRGAAVPKVGLRQK